MRWVVALATAFAAATLAGGASAEPKVRCEVMPPAFIDPITDIDLGPKRSRVEWGAMGSTTLDCPDMVIGTDVWEHAVVSVPSDGAGPVRGRAQIEIEFTGAGITVPFEGTVRGVWDDTDIVHVISARSPGGARIELRQTAMVDFDSMTLELDVVQGFLDIWQEILDT